MELSTPMVKVVGDEVMNVENPHSRIAKLFIPHDHAEAALKALDRTMKYGHGYQRGSTKLLLLLGPSRSGKSLILERFESKFPPFEEETGFVRPIVYISIPEKSTIKALLTALLQAYGDPKSEMGTTVNKLARVKLHIQEQRTQLLILDEGHHLFDPDADRLTYSVSESIKSILNLGLCPLVLAGMPHTSEVVNRNPQLKGRLLDVVKLNGLRWNHDKEQVLFRAILYKFEKESGFPAPSGLSGKELAHAIWKASDGLIGLVSQLLVSAAIRAEEDGSSCLSVRHLFEAYNSLHATDNTVNPFGSPQPLTLTVAGKPSQDRRTSLRKGKTTKLRLPR